MKLHLSHNISTIFSIPKIRLKIEIMKTLNKVLFATLISAAAATAFAAEEQNVEAAASEAQATEVAQEAVEAVEATAASEAAAK